MIEPAVDNAKAVFTIGHSTRTLEQFTRLLKSHGVTRVVDVRTIPRSRHNPQFNLDTLPAGLGAAGSVGARAVGAGAPAGGADAAGLASAGPGVTVLGSGLAPLAAANPLSTRHNSFS